MGTSSWERPSWPTILLTPAVLIPSQSPACGSFSWAIWTTARDRLQWVLRSSREDNLIKFEFTNLLHFEGEAAIFDYIKLSGTVPVPAASAYREVDL